jgi:hypothetical protein
MPFPICPSCAELRAEVLDRITSSVAAPQPILDKSQRRYPTPHKGDAALFVCRPPQQAEGGLLCGKLSQSPLISLLGRTVVQPQPWQRVNRAPRIMDVFHGGGEVAGPMRHQPRQKE